MNWEVFDSCFYRYEEYPSDRWGTAYFTSLKDAWAYYMADRINRHKPRSRAAHPDFFIDVD